MKQAMVKQGTVEVEEMPVPFTRDETVLVQTAYSFISTGTEISGMKSSDTASAIGRILRDPARKLKRGFELIKSVGIKNTIDRALGKGPAGTGTQTGYSLSGVVIDVGSHIKDIKVGDRVACAGAGIANHAEFAAVPRNLLVKVPESCSLKDASSVTLGAIAMQGVRQADLKLGEIAAVTGLGLLGQLTVQILKASGCRVIGIDLDPERIKLAKDFGADLAISANDPALQDEIKRFTGGYGVDASLLTAATSSDAPLQQAMEITRKKGKVVVVGAVGLNLQRSPFYQKEIDLRISCSYGPGRYDPSYEQEGHDYPYGYVRWTENRNMELFLDLIAQNQVKLDRIIQKVYPIEEVTSAFESLKQEGAKPLGVVLDYHLVEKQPVRIEDLSRKIITGKSSKDGKISIGIIGAGGFIRGMHIPNIKKLADTAVIQAIADVMGTAAKETALETGASYSTTDYADILKDPDVSLVIIGTRHNLHAVQVKDAIRAGKAVFVEKPLALAVEDIREIEELLKKNPVPFLVGFNRRFSPAVLGIKSALTNRVNPPVMMYRVNAGYLPPDHWTQTDEGGGRLVGEGCHMIDVLRSLAGSSIENYEITSIRPNNPYALPNDNIILTLTFANGAVGTVVYTAMGAKEIPKEFLEVHWDGKTAVIDDYKELRFYGTQEKNWSSPDPDKGHLKEMELFFEHMKGTAPPPISLEEMLEVSEISIKANEDIFRGKADTCIADEKSGE